MKHINDYLSDYLDGTLGGHLKEQVKSHLVFCDQCRDLLRDIEQLKKELMESPRLAPPMGLETRILSQLNTPHDTSALPISRMFLMPWWKWGGIAASCAIIFVVFLGRYQQNRNTASLIGRNDEFFPAAEKSLPEQAKQDFSYERSRRDMEDVKNEPIHGSRRQLDGIEQKDLLMKPSKDNRAMNPTKTRESYTPQLVEENIEVRSPKPISQSSVGVGNSLGSSFADKKKQSDLEKASVISGFSSERPLNLLISSENELVSIKHLLDPQTIPVVDWSRNELIFIFAGEKPSSGYTVSIKKIDIQSVLEDPRVSKRVIEYQIFTPDSDMAHLTVITTPYILQVVPRFSGPTVFVQTYP